ncbi:hypothetical protein N0V83_009897 [Neocucurbitaria cava]|uniref:Uncharacterized protein n=1 Tax=Neocucurbitaria cava TaxID=798079 RepID=A0A9W8XZ77_9PLEO|nr:hypothetical protein N0V83_009897 [Neocucurbitaria cava]
MAGYGNRTAPDYLAENLEEEHTNTRLGLHDSQAAYSNAHSEHGSGTTGGAGFGNKRSSMSKPSPEGEEADEEEFRFGVHKDTSPYSHATPHGSGTTGGAGFGNKTGSFGESSDSTLGKVMEKAGHLMRNEKMVEKGRGRGRRRG